MLICIKHAVAVINELSVPTSKSFACPATPPKSARQKAFFRWPKNHKKNQEGANKRAFRLWMWKLKIKHVSVTFLTQNFHHDYIIIFAAQISEAPVPIALTFLAFTVASLIPMLKGANPKVC